MSDPSRQTSSAATIPRQSAQPPTEQQSPCFVVRVMAGVEAGASFRIEPDAPNRVLVGKSPACQLRLTDPTVSRRHLALEPTEEGLKIVDLESMNGTAINGLRVKEALLQGEERIVIGDTTLVVEREAETVVTRLSPETSFGRLVGASPAMRRLYPLLRRLAQAEVPVVIEGETGTGKEVLAESIHDASRRADGPFVVFDCTTMPSNLIESALFGHERGAFTGATEMRKGVFEQADGGTLLIDEIGDLDLELQAKLLRALERSEVQRLGSNRWREVDVRILAATRRDLDQAVQEGRFRDDLFYRLAVTRVELPPLRRRVGDVALLSRHFWRRLADADQNMPESLVADFERYNWPGNIRELQNAVARRVALGDFADQAPLPMPSGGATPPEEPEERIEDILDEGLPFPRAKRKAMARFERLYLERILAEHDGDVAKAADAAGVARRYFRLLRARNRGSTD